MCQRSRKRRSFIGCPRLRNAFQRETTPVRVLLEGSTQRMETNLAGSHMGEMELK